jgi:hypothetical protein
VLKRHLKTRRPLVFLGMHVSVLALLFSLSLPVYAQSVPRANATGAAAQTCFQPPQDGHFMALSDAQLSQYGLPVHAALASDPVLQDAILKYARHRYCADIPGSASAPPAPNVMYDANWAGNEARGSRATYRWAEVEFKVPSAQSTSYQSNSTASFWAGVGGDGLYQSSYGLIQAGVTVFVNATTNVQTNSPWWEIVTNHVNDGPYYFTNFTVHTGDTILVYVDSNLSGSGTNTFIVEDLTNGGYGSPTNPPRILSDSATGECIGERNSPQLVDFGSVGFTHCVIGTNSTSKGINLWPHNYYVVTDNGKSTGRHMIDVGSITSNENYPVIFRSSI